jgi:tetratricopeptide (TPR) repeat protein
MPVDLSDAIAEHRRGNLERAASEYESILAADPEQPDALYLLGVIAVQKGDPQRAQALIGRAATLRPGDAVIHANLAEAYRALGDTDGTVRSYQTAVRLDPNHADFQSSLAFALANRGEPAGAIAHFRAAIRLRPDFAAAHHGLGEVLQSLGQLEEAKVPFAEAVRLLPELAKCHVSLGHVCELLGETDQAIAAFREALRCDPRHPEALAWLAARLRDKLPQADQAAIEGLLADPTLPVEAGIPLTFALAQVLDAREEFDRAAELSTRANALQSADFQNRGWRYSPDRHRLFIDKLMATFSSDFFDRVRGYGIESERPVFIVGLPRSGTTLTEQILASHPQVHGAGELTLARRMFGSLPSADINGGMPFDFLPSLDRERVQTLGAQYLSELTAIDDKAERVVDKMPENTIYLGLIATVFPRAKIIHCRRDLRDVALSCWMTDFREVRWACEFDLIARRIHEYQRLMEHWRRVLPIRVLEVDYESLVADLEPESKKLVNGCGLDWDPACLEFHKNNRPVKTASIGQVRRPIYTSSIGRWKNYERTLAPLFAHLDGPG